MPTKRQHSNTRSAFLRISKLHIIVGGFFVVQIIAYDASKLITPETVLKRWVATSIFILVAATAWLVARTKTTPHQVSRAIWLLATTDIAMGCFSVYTQRGMASRAVILFILPILVAGCLHRKSAIYLTALVAAVTYTATAIAYFVLNFNEGYKIELYGEILFYSAFLLATAGMVWALVRDKH